jgi:formate hydrogenlyase subunit 3/multisubunit Na+/H+ antiporter MnhD subunit
MIALLRVFAALTLFAASAHAYVDEDTSRKLLYSGKGQIGLWIAHNEGDV